VDITDRQASGQRSSARTGIDIFAPAGTPVQAPGDGQIVMGSMGLLLKLNNGPYMRLVHVQPNVSPGQRVHKGDPIAIIGDPSLSQSYQHADVAFSSSPNNWQMNGPNGPGGMGGDMDARQVLQQLGVQEQVIPGATGGIMPPCSAVWTPPARRPLTARWVRRWSAVWVAA
jgi:hypothetical protein